MHLAILVCGALSNPPSQAEGTPVVEYWTIYANEGESAGGHAALRVGDVVHHVEHRGDGLIRDRREARSTFERTYRGRGNRAIRVLRLDVEDADAEALDATLRRRAAQRDLRLDQLEALEEEIRWLERGLARGALEIDVPGLALFESTADGCRTTATGAPAGSLYVGLAAALHRARSELDARLEAATRAEPSVGAGRFRGVLEAAQLVAALEVIASCRPLREGASTMLRDGDPLAPAEREAWRQITLQLEQDLARLVSSRRPDRGLALLLTTGRLQAARRAVRSGRWVLLGGFAEADLPPTSIQGLPGPMRRARAESIETRFAASRAALVASATAAQLEPWLDRVERDAHDAAHARAETRHGRPPPEGVLRASRALERPVGRVALPYPRDVRIDALRARRDALVARRTALRRTLGETLGYDLVRRNCVTELLDALDEAGLLAEPARIPGTFVPAVAHAHLARLEGTRALPERPSARASALETALEDAPGRAGRAAVRARESTTVTSRLYTPHRDDSVFLFFADRPAATRPLAGIANLVWASGAGALGVLTAPFDSGSRLSRSARGIVMSLPEIFFLSVRKGSYVVAPPIAEAE